MNAKKIVQAAAVGIAVAYLLEHPRIANSILEKLDIKESEKHECRNKP